MSGTTQQCTSIAGTSLGHEQSYLEVARRKFMRELVVLYGMFSSLITHRVVDLLFVLTMS